MNRQEVLDLRTQTFMLMHAMNRHGNLLPEQHALETLRYVRSAADFIQGAAELGEVDWARAMFKAVAECLLQEVEWLRAKQAYLDALGRAE